MLPKRTLTKKITQVNSEYSCSKNIEEDHYANMSVQYIEDIQMILLNMAFISSSEVENIYIL